jgi:hypothetical protein
MGGSDSNDTALSASDGKPRNAGLSGCTADATENRGTPKNWLISGLDKSPPEREVAGSNPAGRLAGTP